MWSRKRRTSRPNYHKERSAGGDAHHVLRSVAEADPDGKFIGVQWDTEWLIKSIALVVFVPRMTELVGLFQLL